MDKRQEEIVETESGRKHDQATACKDYESNAYYGQYLDGNPCANCRRPETAHTAEARKRWQTTVATMTFQGPT